MCLLLSTRISYVTLKLHEFKFQEELFLDISTPEDETTVGYTVRLTQQCVYYILTYSMEQSPS